MDSENNIYSSDQAHLLHHTFFDPSDYGVDETKATLLIVHGMAEHSGRYEAFAKYLATQGIAVVTYDHLGHGKTAKNSDELGFIASEHPVQTILKDVVIMANALKQRHAENLPHFIMGHSMGSFIVRNVLKHHGSEFSGAVLMGTSDKDLLVKALIPIFSGLNKVAPKHASTWAGNLMNKVLNNKLDNQVTASKFAWVTESPEAIAAYEADPFCGFEFTNNGYLTLFTLMNASLNMDWFSNLDTDFPMIMVSGKDDPIGNMGKGIDTLVHRMTSKGFGNVKKIIYPNMRHEPLNEVGSQMVFEDIGHWLLSNR